MLAVVANKARVAHQKKKKKEIRNANINRMHGSFSLYFKNQKM